MNDSESLWRCIHAQFAFHRKSTDPDAQAAMDRVAKKCLRLPAAPSFNSANCTVREVPFSREDLAELEVYHPRVNGYPSSDPIVVLIWGVRKVVIEGNTRVNRWRAGSGSPPFPAILVMPNETHAA